MSKIHVIKDESLGGILREYVEVERKAKIGEKIVIVRPYECSVYAKGDIFTVEKYYENHPEYEDGVEIVEDYYFIYHYEYHTLEPTDIVHIDGKKFRMVERKAKVGEKVIVTETHPTLVYTELGEIVEIIEEDGLTGGIVKPHAVGEKGALYHFQYHVLEPVENETIPIEVTENDASPQVVEILDLLANISTRLVKMEKRFAETNAKVNMLIEDVALLDDRTRRDSSSEIATLFNNVRTLGEEVERIKAVFVNAADK